MTNNNFAILIERIQPIINSCAGFIKTDGYMTHIPGFILMMVNRTLVLSNYRLQNIR